MINLFNKTDDLIKMINLFSKRYDFVKRKIVNKKGKDVISEKIKANTCFADKDLSSWTGLGRSGHDQITTFGQISHASAPKISF